MWLAVAVAPEPTTRSWTYKSADWRVICEMFTPSDVAKVSVAGSDGSLGAAGLSLPQAATETSRARATDARRARREGKYMTARRGREAGTSMPNDNTAHSTSG